VPLFLVVWSRLWCLVFVFLILLVFTYEDQKRHTDALMQAEREEIFQERERDRDLGN
jgi:uncharacterized membrane protein